MPKSPFSISKIFPFIKKVTFPEKNNFFDSTPFWKSLFIWRWQICWNIVSSKAWILQFSGCPNEMILPKNLLSNIQNVVFFFLSDSLHQFTALMYTVSFCKCLPPDAMTKVGQTFEIMYFEYIHNNETILRKIFPNGKVHVLPILFNI